MASKLTTVSSLRKRQTLRFHGNRKGALPTGFRVVAQRTNTTVLQDRVTGRLKTVKKDERVFAGRVKRLK